ncbi:MAG TPA: DNA polymerase III subunit delta [Alphaproteobacteria bacterium]|nr:DNA polymerase III subunit delta [Alphaproteobacteria bacterium]
MKVPANRADRFVREPDAGVRVVLVYGPDSGLARERADHLVRAVVGNLTDPFRLADFTGAELQKDPARLSDELGALSLTGGRRAVRVRDAGDGVAVAVRQALDGPETDTLAVLEAGDLGPRSSLRKLCEAAGNAAAVPCYLPDADATARLVRETLGQAGVGLDAEAEALLADRLVGDRQLARRELEKLIAYAGEGGRIDAAAVQASVGDSAEQSLDDLVMATADGDRAMVDRVLEKALAEGVSPVAVLRAAQRHFGRLHLAASRIGQGDTPDQAMAALKPPVFFKAQPRVRAQLRRWTPNRLGDALARLIDAEADCKRTGIPPETVTARVLLQLATMARGRG